ncbi:MAG: hypothetical protein HY237_08300 [Acidobacteria bacterium]|nr:hypothetical protein [Acidobacteriota bacterium]
MHPVPSSYILWVAGTVLELLAATLAIRHGLFRRLPVFTGYLFLVVAHEIGWWAIVHSSGYASPPAFYFYWVSQALLLSARALAIAELCQSILRPYRGVWALAWRILLVTASGLLSYAAWASFGNRAWITLFILTAQRGLELAAVAILITLMLISRYYGIQVQPLQRLIALGLGFYSAVQILNNSFMREFLGHYFDWWNWVRASSFQVALVLWLLALRKPLPATAPAPALLPQEIYDDLTPQVSYRLRALNDRLLEMLKP